MRVARLKHVKGRSSQPTKFPLPKMSTLVSGSSIHCGLVTATANAVGKGVVGFNVAVGYQVSVGAMVGSIIDYCSDDGVWTVVMPSDSIYVFVSDEILTRSKKLPRQNLEPRLKNLGRKVCVILCGPARHTPARFQKPTAFQ